MDHHPSLPGLLCCQCCVLLYYRSIALSLGSAPISCCFSSPWNRVDSTLQTSSQKIHFLIKTGWFYSWFNILTLSSSIKCAGADLWTAERNKTPSGCVCMSHSLPESQGEGVSGLSVQLAVMLHSQPHPMYPSLFPAFLVNAKSSLAKVPGY